ncbi:MAG: PucR family transcriptional regulator [Actinomycetes bacterium]
MLLRDLLTDEALELRLLTGSPEQLDRPLRWVFTTDLLDPGRYLSGGELVVTGLVWRSTPADSETFVAALAERGAAALAAGDARFGTVPEDVVDACRRWDLPLLSVREHVSFARVTERVMGAVAVERGARLAATLGRQRRLISEMAEGRNLDELARSVSEATGRLCRVLTATGRHLVDAGCPLPAADVDRVVGAFLSADGLPAVTASRGRPDARTTGVYSVFAVGSSLAPRVAGWMVVVDGDWSSWEPDVLEAVGELAAIAALERARREEGQRGVRPLADHAVALLADGVAPRAEVLLRLGQAGLGDLQLGAAGGLAVDRVAVAVADLTGGTEGNELTCSLLQDAASHLAPPLVARSPDGLAVAVVAAEHDEPAEVLETALGRLGPGLGRERLRVGLSRPAPLDALAGAYEAARQALRLARLQKGPFAMSSGREIRSHVVLLSAVPDDVRADFARGVLGPVLAYDDKHDAGLARTLDEFLRQSGSWRRTGQALHLHVNTVRYRMARVEQLTGRDLGVAEDRVDLFLALRSLPDGAG